MRVETAPGIKPSALLDFAVAPSGKILALVADNTVKSAVVLELSEDPAVPATPVDLQIPLQAWRLYLNAKGELTVLGLRDGDYQKIAEDRSAGELVSLIHRLGPGGEFLEFLFPPKGTSEWRSSLFRIAETGQVQEIRPASPGADTFLSGIHKSEDRLLLEWASLASQTKRIPTTPAGISIRTLKNVFGRILELRSQPALTVLFSGQAGYKIFSMRLSDAARNW